MPTVAITGAAGAIGSVTAETFADAGWDLALLDYGENNEATLESTFPDAHVANCDLTDADAAHDAFAAIDDAMPLDAVLAIAGGFAMQPAAKATMDDYRHMMDINFRTLFNTAQAAWPVLTKQDQSFFLGVSAPAATDGQANAALYGASKGAVAGYVKSLDREGRDAGQRALPDGRRRHPRQPRRHARRRPERLDRAARAGGRHASPRHAVAPRPQPRVEGARRNVGDNVSGASRHFGNRAGGGESNCHHPECHRTLAPLLPRRMRL